MLDFIRWINNQTKSNHSQVLKAWKLTAYMSGQKGRKSCYLIGQVVYLLL